MAPSDVPESGRAALDEAALRAALTPPDGPWAALRVTDETGSTNADAAVWARDGAPHGSVVTADHQVAGRGRLDRSFVIPRRSGIAVSVVWRPDAVPPAHWVWLPLVAGLALDATLRDLGVVGGLKWPNDVLVDGRKISGILLERVETGGGPAAVVGIGLNVDLAEEELPVPHATSLRLVGATTDRTAVLVRLLHHLDAGYRRWAESGAGGDLRALRQAYRERCDTLGRAVDVSMPDGTVLSGEATDVDEHGRLVVAGTAVSAGDVTHVRPATPPA